MNNLLTYDTKQYWSSLNIKVSTLGFLSIANDFNLESMKFRRSHLLYNTFSLVKRFCFAKSRILSCAFVA